MSGLNIFNAHPTLNWGKSSYDGTPPVLEIGALQQPDGELIGVTRVFGHEFTTTGFLGASKDRSGEMVGARVSLVAHQSRTTSGWQWRGAGIFSLHGCS